jgi:prepilin-type N-terminal cleavage/methylation domain-containing protein
MQISKQKGFTLIELLVVIVIIGILATISVATFSGYFAKARDAERQAAVRNAATVLKTARAVETIQSFDYDRTEGLDGSTADIDGGVTTIAGVENVLSAEGGFIVPEPSTTDYEYVYVEPTTNPGNSCAIFICSEENAAAPAGAGDRCRCRGAQLDRPRHRRRDGHRHDFYPSLPARYLRANRKRPAG